MVEAIADSALEGDREQTSDIRVNEEGEWTSEGSKIVREDIIRLFLENLVRHEDGHYSIEWQGTRCAIDVADSPFVVTRVDLDDRTGIGEPVVLLTLKYLPNPEKLDPATLIVGPENILYCQVRDGRFPARFSRPAYYQLAEWIMEDEATGAFYLELGSTRYPIQMLAQ